MTISGNTPVRTPVRRKQAERYILLMLLSFAGSISLTRLFLKISGYPQIGNGELHIAHVLWGGLLLFIGTLLPLLFVNRWAYTITAILSGVGIGLFIDEVGKFITQNNDYFYPAAAPIIYAFFLISVLLYTQVRRRRYRDARTELYHITADLEEVLDHDLSEIERKSMLDRLEKLLKETEDPNLTLLISNLLDFVKGEKVITREHQLNLYEKMQLRLQTIEKRFFSRLKMRIFILCGLFFVGIWALFFPFTIITHTGVSTEIQDIFTSMITRGTIRNMTSLGWLEIRMALEISGGLLLFVAVAMILLRKEKRGMDLAYLCLIFLLTVVNLFVFYFDQFATVVNALAQLIVLLAVIFYRKRFFEPRS
ncbi:MAG TPA: hypothetical protein PKW33_06135 [Anaerolineaceae bacterium]|nr:hypothetical protein [Anaerolineaceae bacterium]HPN51147.1 hypothetical protein [Anaerolineaceae bacterium]